MAYTPHTSRDVEEMLRSIGAGDVDDLFRDIPSELLLRNPVGQPSLDEFEVARHIGSAAAENRPSEPGKLFLGAGAYDHYTPAAVHALISRGEFVTCYTPYQAEVSQGTLQAIFEFQSHICSLTAMEVANASMYDGATALAEACLMAVRTKRRSRIYLPSTLHPNYRAVIDTFLRHLDIELIILPEKRGRTDFAEALRGVQEAAAVVVQTPNFWGVLEEGSQAKELAEGAGALLIASCNPTALALITPPGEFGADIAVGETQPLGIPLQYGGPYAGYFATREELIRQMPGRIVGRTTDPAGKEGFVLTLQTREQHIRRERATSNICTNQGLFALMATMYMTFVGREGLVEVAESCAARARQLIDALTALPSVERLHPEAPFFQEAALQLPVPASTFLARLRDEVGIIGGLDLSPYGEDLENAVLVCASEMHTREDIERYVKVAGEVLAEAAVV